jgi:hypothetical protein
MRWRTTVDSQPDCWDTASRDPRLCRGAHHDRTRAVVHFRNAFKHGRCYNTTMKNAAKEVAYFLNNRPLCFMSTVFGLRDILVGIALAWPREYDRTVLYSNLNSLGGARLYGVVLALIALFVVVTAVSDNTRYTQMGLRVQSWFWLFAALSYALTGFWVFALANLLMCAVPAGYTAFYYKYTPIWDSPKRVWRTQHGMEVKV